ncbi:MAG TPA: VWA domain-containing protein [Acidimicrobiales bacterium]|nr:VWA domain-containing protein [Acidimicrobiales bacterium]
MTDLAAVAVSFGELLHAAGMPTTPERSGRFAQAVAALRPLTIDDLYWAARVTLVTDHEHLGTFDRVFAQVFRGLVDVADHRGDPNAPPPPSTRPVAVAGPPSGGEPEPPGAVKELAIPAASRQERLATVDFSELAPAELAELQHLMRQLRLAPPERSGRRHRRHRHGDRLDVRATLRRSHRSGGDPVVQIRRRNQPKRRRLVVLCDISGSMEPYARAYLQFLYANAGAAQAEVFTFATQLTRLTRALATTHPDLALAQASVAAPDWRGGTRIGEAIKTFIDDYGRRGMARGAVVVIVSDGWERDDPALLGEQMARLHRLAHRIVWVNPRSADPRYQPLAGGMAASLPHCDAVVSGHSLAALDGVVAAISGG